MVTTGPDGDSRPAADVDSPPLPRAPSAAEAALDGDPDFADPEDGDEAPIDWSWAREDPGWVPPEIDTTIPSAARMYDYALGGKDNFAVDRDAVDRLAEVFPDYRHLARANRNFLVKAVTYMAEEGVSQFIELGAGIPTSPNVHEVARAVQPKAAVVYVDHDPMVLAHIRALRAVEPGVVAVGQDLRQPKAVLEDPKVRATIDFARPVGVLLCAVLQFVRRDLGPRILTQYHRRLVPGSHVALSVPVADGTKPEVVRRTEALFAATATPMVWRSTAQVEQLFEGLNLVSPGLVDVPKWRADEECGSVRVLAGVARKP